MCAAVAANPVVCTVPTTMRQSDELPVDGHLPVRTEMSERPEAAVLTGGTSFSPVSTVLERGGAVEHATDNAITANPTRSDRWPSISNTVMRRPSCLVDWGSSP